MDLAYDDMTQAASDAVRAVLGKRWDISAARAAEPLGHDAKLWSDLSSAGLAGLGIPEPVGGGAALLALVVASYELGRILAPVPFAEHAVAGRLIASCAPEHPWLESIASGERIATVAPSVSGSTAVLVPAGAVADVVLALPADELVTVTAAPPMRALPNIGDLPVADRALTEGERSVIATGDRAREAFEQARREWLVLMAAWLTGLASAGVELATRWVKERHQFGVPIGSFQAVQHGLADLPGLVDGSLLLAQEAAWSADTGNDSITGASGAQLALMALAFASDTAEQATKQLVQYHGGLGVAQEHDAQLFFRRARAYPLLAGSQRERLRALADELLADGS